MTGTINTDVKPSIGIPMVRTVSNASAQLYEVTGYINPLNKKL